MKEYYTDKEAGQLIGMSESYIRKLRAAKKLKYYKFGGKSRIKKTDFERFIRQREAS